MRRKKEITTRSRGSALLEFAIAVPLLVVFIVGIFDFSAAFTQKQKIEHAAETGAIAAGAQTMADIDTTNPNPDSLQPVVSVVFNSLASDGVLPLANQGTCTVPAPAPQQNGLKWTYQINNCPDSVNIIIDRGLVDPGTPASVRTSVSVSYLYHWRFNSAIQLLFPGASYAATTNVTEAATTHNQL